MNKVLLIGNLTRDVELRTTPNGKNVANFGLAVQRRRAPEGQPQADFFNVTAWGALGETCAKYLSKGRKAAIAGTIQIRQYDAADGTKRTAVDIIAEDVQFLSPAAQGAGAEGRTDAPPIPATTAEAKAGGFTETEDELPF